MADRTQRSDGGKRRIEGFDRAVRELNAFLLVLAIGLATLDLTCFFAFKVRDALPAATLISRPAPNNQAMVALMPTTSPAAGRGW